MSVVIFICLLAFTSCQNRFAVNNDAVNYIKNHSTWEPVEVNKNVFKDWTTESIKKMLGFIPQRSPMLLETNNQTQNMCLINSTLPENYITYESWPGCSGSILEQGECGGCWAFGASETLSELRCIANLSQGFVQLSPQDPISCDKSDLGCNGGNLQNVFNYMTKFGLVTESCFPYISGALSRVPRCPSTCIRKNEPAIKYQCKNGSVVNYGLNIECMKSWIYTHGPMEVGYIIYEDFMNYGGGVYSHIYGENVGGHAVKLIGWGKTSSGENYWVCQNSWGPMWGMQGYFWIKQGEAEIDSEAYSCIPE